MVKSENDSIIVQVNSRPIFLSKDVFILLMEHSCACHYVDYKKALSSGRIGLSVLKKLSKEGGFPYTLFFAPIELVKNKIDECDKRILEYIGEDRLSISGRGNVEIRDVSVILKEIRNRQLFLRKQHQSVGQNALNDFKLGSNVGETAELIIDKLGLDINLFRNSKNKTDAFQYAIDVLENNNIIVSRSQSGYMPQNIPKDVTFSGFVVKDKKFPAIFINTRDDSTIEDPVGRQILSLFLLCVCIVFKKYQLVTFDSISFNVVKDEIYLVTEEVLFYNYVLPRCDGIDDVKKIASEIKITPSAVIMHLKRVNAITEAEAVCLLNELARERMEIINGERKNYVHASSPEKHVVKYNGRLYTETVLALVSAGKMGIREAERRLLFNKHSMGIMKGYGM